jgi:Contractile injection system tape measure protein
VNNESFTDSQMNDNFNQNNSKNEYLFTDFAGIVLINPFLKDLFLKLKYISEGQFINDTKQNRAVHLVHFIAGGHLQAPEYEEVLAKILCGMPIEKPIDFDIKLTKKETNEAEKMMEAAISWWGAIGNTTPDGLREGFLKREGKIKQTEMGWELFVQPQTLDIMLQQLPFGWGFSFIKLSWMRKILTVDWQ